MEGSGGRRRYRYNSRYRGRRLRRYLWLWSRLLLRLVLSSSLSLSIEVITKDISAALTIVSHFVKFEIIFIQIKIAKTFSSYIIKIAYFLIFC